MARSNKASAKLALKWYDRRLNSLGLAAVSWLIGWFTMLYALSTASMWAYLALYVLFIFGLNRLVRAIRGKRDRQAS